MSAAACAALPAEDQQTAFHEAQLTGPAWLARQIMSLLQTYDVKWPNSTRQVLTWSKVVNVGVGITAPDCADYNWNFLLQYIVTMVSPVRRRACVPSPIIACLRALCKRHDNCMLT